MGTDTIGSGLPWVDAIAASFDLYGFDDFHRRVLPELVARHGHLVVADVAGAAPIAFRVGDAVHSWRPSADGIEVIDDDAQASTVVELSDATFSEWVHELLTASGAVRTGRAQL